MARVRADLILKALHKKHTGKQIPDAFFTEVKNGRTQMARPGELLILDAVAFKKSWVNPLITGYEVKVSRNDFLRDEKWPAYLQYCHQFYFVSPAGVIEMEDLSEGIGLIHYNPEKKTLRTKRKSNIRHIEMPLDMLYYLVIARVENSEHPFFRNKREYFEAYLEDKKERKAMGYVVASKMAKDISELATENEEMKRELSSLRRQKEELDKIKVVCKAKGLSTFWGFDQELEKVLSQKASDRVLYQVDELIKQAEKVKKMLMPEVSCM